MLKTASRPLSPTPQHPSDRGISSVRSSTNTWVSSLTSYTTYSQPAADEKRGWPGRRPTGSSTMAHDEMPDSRKSSRRPSMTGSTRSGPTNISSSNLPLSAYSTYNPSSNGIISPPPAAYDPTPRSPAAKPKIKPLLKRGTNERAKIDLNKSMAENEGLGIFVNSSASGRADAPSRRTNHTRSSSGVSAMSNGTTSSAPRGAGTYVHPMRATPSARTPPVQRSRAGSRNDDSSDDEDRGYFYRAPSRQQNPLPSTSSFSISHSYAPVPTLKRTPPPLHIRTTSASSNNARPPLRATPSQTTLPPTPSSLRYANNPAAAEPFPPMPSAHHHSTTSPTSPSPDPAPFSAGNPTPMTPATTVPGAASVRTARSSLDSSFRTKRSRTNTALSEDPVAAQAQVAALRAEFQARERAKEQKWRAREARKAEKRDRSERRKEREHGRADAGYGAAMQVGYYRHGGPSDVSLMTGKNGKVVDEEIEWMRKGKRVPKGKKGKGKEKEVVARKNEGERPGAGRWAVFWFGVKSMFLRLKRSFGGS